MPARGRSGPVITSVQLIDLGQQLMDESKPTPGTPIRMADAIRYRDGLMIALLGFIPPLRRKNLAALEIGRHLIREGDGWFVIVPRTETKKESSAIEVAIPEFLNPYLATYLDDHSSEDAPASNMQRAVGEPMRGCSHLFRDLANLHPAHAPPARYPYSSARCS